MKVYILIPIILSMFILSCSPKEGCTDRQSDNFDFEAEIDDGSCVYSGCTDPNSDNYDPKATINDGFCYRKGCTNQYAKNYDPFATITNDDCIFEVSYTIECTSCNITFENNSGGTSQLSNVNSSWVYSFAANQESFVYISAQNQNDFGDITVKILLGDYVFKTSSSSGAYVIATANESLPN